MNKIHRFRLALRELSDWDPYLLENSGLPGPRGNIELAIAAADEASPAQIRQWLEWDQVRAPANTAREFLAFCGVLGLGRLAADGDDRAFRELRGQVGDERWRAREAAAMAIQRIGDVDFDKALEVVAGWVDDGWLARRAIAAGLCEPRLLTSPERTAGVLDLLDAIRCFGFQRGVRVGSRVQSGLPASRRTRMRQWSRDARA